MEEQLSQKYQQKTDKAHILDNPDTYIGSVEEVDNDMWVMNETQDKIVQKNIRYIPGLYKLFDEGIVNCRDHVIRMHEEIKKNPNAKNQAVTTIEVNIDESTGRISMFNDGNGIDVATRLKKRLLGGKTGSDSNLCLFGQLKAPSKLLTTFANSNTNKPFAIISMLLNPPKFALGKRARHIHKFPFFPITNVWVWLVCPQIWFHSW